MAKTRKARPLDAYAAPIEIHEVDGVPLSAEEINFAKLVADKVARTAKGSVIDFSRASKRRLKSKVTNRNR